MATSNFITNNASRIFVIPIQEEFDFDDAAANVTASLIGIGHESTRESWDRYDGRYMTEKFMNECVWNPENGKPIEFDVHIKTCIRSGYYSDANLDWEIGYSLEGYGELDIQSVPDEDYIKELLDRNSYAVSGETDSDIFDLLASMIRERIVRMMSSLVEETENEFRQNSSASLRCVGRFSNGEAIYEQE
jgi:hypothetical protein